MVEATATIKVPDTFFEGGIVGDAFHGTLADSAALIEQQGFVIDEEIASWYGPGAYFFEGDYGAARDFIVGRIQRNGMQGTPAVIHAEVDLGRVFHVNLIDRQVKLACASLASQLGRDIPNKVVYRLICAHLRKEGKVDSLRVVRQTPKRGYQQYAVSIFLVVFDPTKVHVRSIYRPCVDPGESKVKITLSA